MEEQNTSQTATKSKHKKWIIIAGLLVCIAGIALFFGLSKDKKENIILTVGDYSYNVDDLLYYIYEEEEMGSLYAEIYAEFYGTDYWTYPDEENNGLTGEQVTKKAVIRSAKKDLVLYQEAKKAGYKLTDEDKANAEKACNKFKKNLTKKQLEKMESFLLDYFEKQEVIAHYKEDLLAKVNFDETGISSQVSEEACREYKYEYYCIYKTDDEDNPYAPEVLQEHYNTLTSLTSQLTADNSMEELLTDDMDYVEYSDSTIVEEDGECYGIYNNIDLDSVIKSMENGQVSAILEDSYSYFVVRMIDNDSKDYYNECVREKVESAQKKIYNEEYRNVKSKYEMKVNQANWNKIKLGYYIY